MSADTFSRIRREFRDAPKNDAHQWICRAEVEVGFARILAEAQQADKAAAWNALIDQAIKTIEGAEPALGLDGLKKAILEAEAIMADIGREAKTFKVHCIGHGHIDMNWMWSWPETVATTHDTFASVLALMDEYPGFTYAQSQASVYALVERHFPEMFEKIKARVREGVWEVTAVHWVEGDKNIASGESLCNHLLRTRKYFEEKFGLEPEDVPIDWEPDTFGHANTLPSFLARAGVKYYYCCRPGGGSEHFMVGGERPPLFYWKAPDGSKVLVNQEKTWYNSDSRPGDNVAAPVVRIFKETGIKEWLYVYGVGNHGGGPTRAELNYLVSMRDWPIYPTVEFSLTKKYLDRVCEIVEKEGIQLPELDHELNFEFTGCYTAQSLIKQANRFSENYLVEAETMAAIASKAVGLHYPKELLKEAWTNTLFNHFHDILPGSGVRETRERAMGMFQEVGAITGAIKRRSGVGLAAKIDTASLLPDAPEAYAEIEAIEKGKANATWEAGPGTGAMTTGLSRTSTGGRRFLPIVIYNPCAWERSEPVMVSLYDIDADPARMVALDEEGNKHPLLYLGQVWNWGHAEHQYVFTPKRVPALGYRTYLFTEGTATVEPDGVTVKRNESFETPWLSVRFDRIQSGILSLHNKTSGWAFQGNKHASFSELQFYKERSRGMTAWRIGDFVGQPVNLVADSYGVKGSTYDWSGMPVGSPECVVVDRRLSVPGTASTVKLHAVVHGLKPRIDFTAEIDWREIGTPLETPALRLCIPVPGHQGRVVYETAFGSIERDECGGEEVPSLRYAHVPLDKGALTLLQDCKYGHCFNDGKLTLTLVRSSTDPDHAPEVAKTTVRFSIVLHDKELDRATLARLGMEWNHPLMVLPANMQRGDAPTRHSFAECLSENAVMTALRPSDDGAGWILRVSELNGRSGAVQVRLGSSLVDGFTKAETVDLIERPAPGRATLEEGIVTVDVPAYGFATVKLS